MHWSKGSIVYQIYPMSFKDSDGDGIGDLAGILEKIDYLNGAENSLGIDAVWLCPFYKSPMRDFGYDISDYTDVNPTFGNMEIFEKLVNELHTRGIKVIVDFVGNHTSDQHPWFLESRQSRMSPKRDWYIWHNGLSRGTPDDLVIGEPAESRREPPNNWISVFGGPAWEYDTKMGQYYYHTFLKEQPDLNWHNPDVQQAMHKVIDFWVSKGVDGFRVDAFYNFIEDSELRDDPINPKYNRESEEEYKKLTHRYSTVAADSMGVITDFVKSILKRHPEVLVVAEAYISPQEMHGIHRNIDSNRFTVFNFSFVGTPFNALEYKNLIDRYLDPKFQEQNPNFLPNFTLGNHDISRLLTRLGELPARVAVFLQFTLPGLKFVYYGDEIGMTDAKIPKENIRDLAAKLIFKHPKTRDPERTPMQWDASLHAGFSKHKPWLPVNENYKTRNVASSERDPGSMLAFYKSLIRFSQTHPELHGGQYFARNSASPNVLSFEIHSGDGIRFLVAVNFGDSIERELLPKDASNPTIIFCTSDRTSSHGLPKYLELLPYEGYVLEI